LKDKFIAFFALGMLLGKGINFGLNWAKERIILILV